MKRKISLVLTFAVAAGLMLGGGAGASASSESSSPLSERFPRSFTGQWTGEEGCLNVSADAVIEVPEADNMPTAAVKRRAFTQQEADRMIEAFLDGGALYEDRGMTKSQVQERLDEYRAMERGELPLSLDGDRTMEDLAEIISRWEKYLEEAPEDGEFTEVSTEFRPAGVYDEQIMGYGFSEGEKCYLNIYNYSDWLSEVVFSLDGFGRMDGDYSQSVKDLEEPLENSMTEAEAIAIADSVIAGLEIENMVRQHTEEVFFHSFESDEFVGTGYKLIYMRSLGGVPLAYTEKNGLSVEEGAPFYKMWGYEKITICVSDGRLVYFNWINPYETPVVDAAPAKLMPFEDIGDIFGKMILVTNDDISEINRKNGFDIVHNFNVDKVQLNLMRIRDKDNFEEGRIVPVWDFWAKTGVTVPDEDYSHLVYDGEYYEVVLTLNAIDGTVIDRGLGY